MSVTFSAERYSSDNLTVATIECKGDNKFNYQNREIIILVDVSGSMSKSMDNLKLSLKCFRRLIPNDFQLTIIKFNSESKLIWSSKHHTIDDFDNQIDGIEAFGSTDIGGAVKKAFRLISKSMSWIILFTDGESTSGIYQKRYDLFKLIADLPSGCKIISLGYGEQYSPKTLSILGEYSHVDTSDKIPLILGSIYGEITTTWADNIKITFEKTPESKVFGCDRPGNLYDGRKYVYGVIDNKSNTV